MWVLNMRLNSLGSVRSDPFSGLYCVEFSTASVVSPANSSFLGEICLSVRNWA